MESQVKGRAKGGQKKNALMTPEQRREQALKMVDAKKARKTLPKVTHEGVIRLVGVEIPCYVLSDGQRVLSQRGISEAFTGSRGGGLIGGEDGAQKTPRFLGKKDIKPFINNELMARISAPIEFLPKTGRSAFGYADSLLPEICEVVIDSARASKSTDSKQYQVADVLIRGFARVGIAALIDEATGYQKDRAKDELAKILEAFVAKELQPYLKTFPAEYYEQLFRLYGYEFPPKDKRPQWRPIFFGKITNEVVYNRLAPEILPELKKAASKAEKKTKLFQWLTSDIGHPKLKDHLISIVSLLKISKTPEEFKRNVNIVHPRFGDTMELDFTASKD
jgi:hypothetical protein